MDNLPEYVENIINDYKESFEKAINDNKVEIEVYIIIITLLRIEIKYCERHGLTRGRLPNNELTELETIKEFSLIYQILLVQMLEEFEIDRQFNFD